MLIFSYWLFSLNFGQDLLTGKIDEHTQSGSAVGRNGDGYGIPKAAQTSRAALETPGTEIWLRIHLL